VRFVRRRHVMRSRRIIFPKREGASAKTSFSAMVAGFFAADRSPEFKTRRQPIKKTLAAF